MTLAAHTFCDAAAARGFGVVSGVPCSWLQPLIDEVSASGAWRYVPAANEGDAAAIAAGAHVGGVRGIALFQNSGLGNAVNPLTSLHDTMRIPVLLLVTHRGAPSGPHDEPQHDLMGRITPDLLTLMGIPHRPFPRDAAELERALDEDCATMDRTRRPVAWIVPKGAMAKGAPPASPPVPPHAPPPVPAASGPAELDRPTLLRAIRARARSGDVLIATTGYTGRTLYALGDANDQLYMVGSMGCAVSFGLGLALARPDRRVIVLDGDGALLMRLGALSSVGWLQPPNLLHFLLDNGVHDSTGGQATATGFVDLAAIAAACRYRSVLRVQGSPDVAAAMDSGDGGPVFVHCAIRPGAAMTLPRPAIAPHDVVARLERHLGVWSSGEHAPGTGSA